MKVKCGAEKEERKVISSTPHLQLQNAHNSLLIGLSQPVARGCCIPLPFPYLIPSLSLSPHTTFPMNELSALSVCSIFTTLLITHIYIYTLNIHTPNTQQNHKPTLQHLQIFIFFTVHTIFSFPFTLSLPFFKQAILLLFLLFSSPTRCVSFILDQSHKHNTFRFDFGG